MLQIWGMNMVLVAILTMSCPFSSILSQATAPSPHLLLPKLGEDRTCVFCDDGPFFEMNRTLSAQTDGLSVSSAPGVIPCVSLRC